MERGALSTAEFKAFAKDYVLFCHITSQIEGEKYGDLLSKKGGTGFPFVVAMDAAGDVLAIHQGARTTEGFAATMASGLEFKTLLDKEELTAAEQTELFMKRLGMNHFDVEQAKAEAAKLKELTAEDQAKIDNAILGLEIQQHAPRSQQDLPISGKVFAEMYRNGRAPTEGRPLELFFVCILEYADQEGDAVLFGEALAKLKAAFGDNPRAAPFFEKQEARLAALKAAAGSGD